MMIHDLFEKLVSFYLGSNFDELINIHPHNDTHIYRSVSVA